MATLLEHAMNASKAFPGASPVYLSALADVFWPEAEWLKSKMHRHNGGARRGVRVAGALAAKLHRAGYLRRGDGRPRNYWIEHSEIERAAASAAQ